MPFDAGGRDGPAEFVLVFVSALIEEMNLVGSGDGDSGIHLYVRNRYPNDPLLVCFQVLDLGF